MLRRRWLRLARVEYPDARPLDRQAGQRQGARQLASEEIREREVDGAVVAGDPDHVALAAERQPRRIICFKLATGGRYSARPKNVVDRSVPEQVLKTPCETPVQPIVREKKRCAPQRHLRHE